MYVVITKYEEGRRKHIIVEEETGRVINEIFYSYKRAEKACRMLNKAIEKGMKRRLGGKDE